MSELSDRIEEVRGRMAQACARSGRPSGAVDLVAATKQQAPDVVTAAAACGLTLFGENRVQEARQKLPLCPGGLTWLMIGHLQRNKVRQAVQLFSGIHSVDSLRLLEAVDAAAADAGVDMPVLLEVNVSGEGSKYGLDPAAVPAVLERGAALANVSIDGLMTMPPFTPDPEGARPCFEKLRTLRDGWAAASGFPLETLSMGMSHDFEVAIEEGATLVRVGSRLFGARVAGD